MPDHDTTITTEPGALDPEMTFIDIAEVRRLTGFGKSKIYDDPNFPLPVSFSAPGRTVRRSRWLKHEVLAYLRERIALRDAAAEDRRREQIAAQERRRAKPTQ